MVVNKRPSWDEHFIELAKVISKRSTCLRRKTGAVLVTRDKWLIAEGYNGAPKGLPHCEELSGCLRERLKIPSGQRHELCRAVHAETNVVIRAALYGASTKNTTVYTTTLPCIICAKILINAGIEQIVYFEEYGDEESNTETRKLLNQAGIILRKFGSE